MKFLLKNHAKFRHLTISLNKNAIKISNLTTYYTRISEIFL